MPKKTAEKTIRVVAVKTCPHCERDFDADSEHSVCPDDQTLLCPTPIDSDIGLAVGDYELISKIGEGSSGYVYIATHKITGQTVAAKLLKLNLLSDPSAVRRFQQEAQAISLLVHPNITSIHEFGVLPNGRPFIIMDYDGPTTLSEVLTQHGALTLERACFIFKQIVDALRVAHHAGILHRDIKPSNIIIDEQNNVKVIDFGIAKINGIETTVTMTRTGATVGTPAYMSPEQCNGSKLDQRSDLYSLACLMYECLTGQKVFPSDNAFRCMNQHSFEPAPPLSKLTKGLPHFLSWAVMTCLQKSPEHRLQSMAELNSLLQAVSDKRTKTQIVAQLIIFKSWLRSIFNPRTTSDTSPKKTNSQKTTPRESQSWIALVVLLVVIAMSAWHIFPGTNDATTEPSRKTTAISGMAEAPANSFISDYATRSILSAFSEIDGEISALKKANRTSEAAAMNKELQKYRSFYNQKITAPAQHRTEVHSISVRKGYGGIGSYRFGKPLPGTVTVNVTDTHNPIVLALTGEQPVIWKITSAPGVHLKKVILTGPSQKVELPQGQTDTPIEQNLGGDNREQNDQISLPYGEIYDGRHFRRVNEVANRTENADLVSAVYYDVPRETVLIGPENTSWRAQYVMWRMRDFYAKCMQQKNESLKISLRKLYFDSVWSSGDFFNSTRAVGQANPYGPIRSTLQRVEQEMDFFSAISVTRKGGKKLWYLIGEGRNSELPATVAEYDPVKQTITPLMKSDDKYAPPGWGYRGITYDTKRDQLIILVHGSDYPLMVYDFATQKWLRKGTASEYGQDLISIAYCAEDDSVYALAVNLLENPYHVYLYQFRDGVLAKATRLSQDFYDVQTLTSLCKVQLQSVGPYVVATCSNDTQLNPEGKIDVPTSAVIERATGKVVFSKATK
ncbi:MAG: serine/threonine-protein kinase [Candidatus Melainabacteria bacterium]|nr:serine/threonine-protein kinase [Candidatus Melainabacteria bacterium]